MRRRAGREFDAAKPAVVFLHGAGCDHTVWQLPARWFAWHGHAALAVDLPGHGRSEGPPLASIGDMGRWVGALLDAAGVRQAALVGHSMGAAAALEGSRPMPERVTRMGLVGTAAAIPVHRDLLAAAKEEPERAYQMMTAWAHGTAAKLGGHPVPGLWMTGGTLALFARNQPGVLHADLEACHAWKSGPEAARRCAAPHS
jgi:pimeloyl-ACP methyl ester carboxylesterase